MAEFGVNTSVAKVLGSKTMRAERPALLGVGDVIDMLNNVRVVLLMHSGRFLTMTQ